MKYDKQEDPLQAQLKTLEMEWDSIKQSISRSDRRNVNTTDSSTATTAVTAAMGNRLFQMEDNSPKELMSLLQNENSPLEEQICEIENGFIVDREAIEVINDRMVDFDNGRLKGRRLFEESEMDSDDGGGGGCLNVAGEFEVSTEFSYKGSENGDGNYDRISGRFCVSSQPPVAAAVKHGGGGGNGGSVTRWMINMTWIGVVIMMFAFGIVAFKCRGEDEQFLVPT